MSESTSSGAYRLVPPAYQAYDTSAGEQMLLRSLTPENIGAMTGAMMNQRSLAMGAQRQYSQQLSEVNDHQRAIAGARIRADELEGLRKLAIAGVQFGGADLSGSPLFRQVFDVNNLLGTDSLRRQGTSSETTQRLATALNQGSEAGVNLDPGQTVDLSPEGLARLRSTTGTTRDERVAGIGAEGHAAASRNPVRITGNGLAPPEVQFSAPTEQAALEGFNRLLPSVQDGHRQRTNPAARPTGTALDGPLPAQQTAPGGGTPTGPAAGTRAPTITTMAEARSRADQLNIPRNANIAEQNVGGQRRWFAILPNNGGTREIK